MKTQLIKLAALLLLLAIGCKKDNTTQPVPQPAAQSSITFKNNYEVDGKELLFDTLLYQTDAGYNYSVSNLQYYLSGISLIKEDSSKIQIIDYHYTDATIASKNTFSVTNIPNGNYIGICFNIGLDSVHNITGALADNAENNNMEWPVGGGYHFMKFEGHYMDTTTLTGFTMHLGTNASLVKENPIYKSFTVNLNRVAFNMTMNLNEWFRNPAVYDFDMDGNFSMGNMMAMQKLAANGVDVFHYKN